MDDDFDTLSTRIWWAKRCYDRDLFFLVMLHATQEEIDNHKKDLCKHYGISEQQLSS